MKRVSILVVVCLLVAALAGCGPGNDDQPTPGPTVTVSESPADESSAIPWRNASDHEGELVTIEGPVAGTFYADTSNGEPTFLNVGKDYPDSGRFTVVIWGEDRGAFPDAPEDMYEGATIRVTGIVDSYEGVPQIEVSSPGDIEVVR